MMFSQAYFEQLEQMHETRAGWGRGGLKFLGAIVDTMISAGAYDVLDYGCGKGDLVHALREFGLMAYGYDPAVTRWGVLPDANPFDFVVCTDVMEHVEEEHIDAVLGHIRSLARKGAFFTISTVPASAVLPDGRNAHLTVRNTRWWQERLAGHFTTVRHAVNLQFNERTPVFVTSGHQ